MALSALLVVLAAAVASATLAWLSHRTVYRTRLPDTGPALGTAAGAVLSFFVVTMAFLLVNSTGALSTARQNNYAEAGAVIDLYLAAEKLPEPAKQQIRSKSEDYLREVIEVEWPQMATGHVDLTTFRTTYQLRQIVLDLPATAPTMAVRDARQAVADVLAQRRVRTTAAGDGAPPFLLVTLIGAAVLSVLFLLLLGWPRGRRGIVTIAVVGGLLAFSIWLVLQINHPYGAGIRVMPGAFYDAIDRIHLIEATGF
ncbi:hypothetical protein [Kitasatospora sp. NPDC002040]|uniref:bestrophin-like domain n=1 Tax=Kitasatospora sp. NPDC002040 TaxID=3154661 RepID=UPI00331A60E8